MLCTQAYFPKGAALPVHQVVVMDDTDNRVIIVDNVNDEFCDADNLVVLMMMLVTLMTMTLIE